MVVVVLVIVAVVLESVRRYLAAVSRPAVALELALLTFQVYDDDVFNGDDFIASATIPVTSLQQGS